MYLKCVLEMIFMTEPMRLLCEYLIEKRVPELVPASYYWHNHGVLEKRSDALYQSLSAEQWDMLEAYLAALMDQTEQEQQALFQATLELARELP